MPIINFELVTEVQGLLRRDFPMADPTLLDPNNANPLLDGEFLELDSSYKMIRHAGGANLPFVVFMERGRYDTQAIGKTTLLFGGTYEANTRIFTGTPALGAGLEVDTVTIDTLSKSGLATFNGGGGELNVGYVTRTAATNGARLRFIQTLV